MAYNLQPLIQTLEQILHPHHHRQPNWILDPSKEPLIQSLLAKARFLNDFFQNPSSLTGHDVVRSLESQIRDAAYRAQNVIEYHLAGQVLSNNKGHNITISPPNLLLEIADREFEPIVGKLANILEGRDMRSDPSSSDLVASTEDLNPKKTVVGISEDLEQLMGELMMKPQSNFTAIPIVGMGGIDKTFLAQTLYDDNHVVRHFDIRAWVVISQTYDVREILFTLLKSFIGKLSDGMINEDIGELHSRLHKIFFGRRYLIVLDDMWSLDAWDSLQRFFPDENNGSRILVTTRNQDVANSVAGSKNLHHQMKLLNEIESWELLRQKVFLEGSCALELELEEVGKNIANGCGGLPLAIHVVGGILSPLEKTQEAWIQVAKDVNSSVNYGQILNILSLSYDHLPNYLKPCFLYMGAFPEDHQIKASALIRLWMAEGFLKPIMGMSFEETARVYLKELVQRNLVSIAQQETKRKAKSYIMHDLLRELCISKAHEEKFLYVGIDAIKVLNPNGMLRLRLSVHASCDQFTHIIESSNNIPFGVCSILLFAKLGVHNELSWLDKYAFGLRLLKVLNMLEANFAKLPQAMEKLVNLRYLAVRVSNSYPNSQFNLCNLQTLILHLEGGSWSDWKVRELLNMPRLRHAIFKGGFFHFVLEEGENVNVINEELQSLSMVYIDDSFPRILKAMPNLKKLGINCLFIRYYSEILDLNFLSLLQILKCTQMLGVNLIIFPTSLIKLTLEDCHIFSGVLNEIGRLPNLQVFKVKYCSLSEECMGEWKPTQGGFQQLRLLVLERFSGLKKWIADERHYPRLEHMIINRCIHLQEIPSGIGDITTLVIIEVHDSANSVEESARKTQEEQIQYGNDTLQLRITSTSEELPLPRLAALAKVQALVLVATAKGAKAWLQGVEIFSKQVTAKAEITATKAKAKAAEAMAIVAEAKAAKARAELAATLAKAKTVAIVAESKTPATLAEEATAVAEAIIALVEANAAEAMARETAAEAKAKENNAMMSAKLGLVESFASLAEAAAPLPEVATTVMEARAAVAQAKGMVGAKAELEKAARIVDEARTFVKKLRSLLAADAEAIANDAMEAMTRATAADAKIKKDEAMAGAKEILEGTTAEMVEAVAAEAAEITTAWEKVVAKPVEAIAGAKAALMEAATIVTEAIAAMAEAKAKEDEAITAGLAEAEATLAEAAATVAKERAIVADAEKQKRNDSSILLAKAQWAHRAAIWAEEAKWWKQQQQQEWETTANH